MQCISDFTRTYLCLYLATKAKAYNTCIAPQKAAYRNCSGAVHDTDIAAVQPQAVGITYTHRLTYDQPAIHHSGLPFTALHPVIHVIRWITTQAAADHYL